MFEGKSYPLLSFDQLVDTDFGLIQIINQRYNNKDTFYWSLLEAPAKYKVWLLYNRKHINPLTVFAKEYDNIELLNDYYNQFMEEEYVGILKQSVITNLFKSLKRFVSLKSIYPIIVCKNSMEVNFLTKLDKDVASKCDIVIDTSYRKYMDDRYTAIYFKNIRDTAKLIDIIEGRNIFVAGYRFNFEDDDKQKILSEYGILLSGITKIISYEPYTEKDFIKGV